MSSKGPFSSKKLQPLDGITFYGIPVEIIHIDGLKPSVRHLTKQGQKYAGLAFSDNRGIKWKIIPTGISERGKPAFLRLYHRNSYRFRGFHSQAIAAWGTPRGVRELINYIEGHEKYECGE